MSEQRSIAPESDEVAERRSDEGPGVPPCASDAFWTCGEGVHALDDPTPFGQENALQKLGKPPFEKSARSRFRLLGYLATVYEHVSRDADREAESDRR